MIVADQWTNIAPTVETDVDGRFVFKGLPTKSNINLRVYAEG
jgi:hypothetical protein